MSAPKILSSIVAAAAIVGSVGYVYAQTQSSSPPATTQMPAATTPPAASDTTTPTTPSTSNDMSKSTSPSTDTTMTPPAEPQAKADRN